MSEMITCGRCPGHCWWHPGDTADEPEPLDQVVAGGLIVLVLPFILASAAIVGLL